MDDIKLLGLQRAEFQRAETMSTRSNYAQSAIIVISIITVFVDTPKTSYFLAISSLIFAIIWLYFSYQAKSSHRTAERSRRAVVFSNGLGIKLGRKSFSDLKMLFKVRERDGKKYEDDNYFKATGEDGNSKLVAIVEESSFWSKHLYKMSAVRYWLYFGGTLIISMLGLLFITLLDVGDLDIFLSQVICLILIWLITGNLFTTALAFTHAASTTDSIESRLSSMATNNEPDEDAIVVVSDYNALVENSPTIPSDLYEKNKERLNNLWDERNN